MTDDDRKELERLARKAWPDSDDTRVHVDVGAGDDREPFVEIYGEHGGYRCVEVSMHARAQPAIMAALRVLAGEPDPRVAELEAEVARLREYAANVERLDHVIHVQAGGKRSESEDE